MGWGTIVKIDAYLSRIRKNEIKQVLEDITEDITGIEEKLKILAIMTPYQKQTEDGYFLRWSP